MSRFVMTLGLVATLSVAWISLDPLSASATSTTGTFSTFNSKANTIANVDAAVNAGVNPQDVVNPAQLTSAQIVHIQNALNNAGFSVIDSGRWDPATVGAVQQFQTSRTLVSNGLLTNQTIADLGVNVNAGEPVSGTSAGVSPTANAAGTFNANNLTSAQISDIQQALRNRGFNVAVNGIWGPSTIAALQQFEVSQGRTSNGALTGQTVADLGVNINAAGAGTVAANAAVNLNTIAPAAGGAVNTNSSIGTTATGQLTPGTSTGTSAPSFGMPPAGTITTPGTFPPSANTTTGSTVGTTH